nr:hypothetical protein [Candidatus Anoxychlamydiales bacterium]
MHNLEEERTIQVGENAYHNDKKEPERSDHISSNLPSFRKVLKKSKNDKGLAFLQYLMNGAHVDTIQLSEDFTDLEITALLLYNLPRFPKDINNLHETYFLSESFLEILLALNEERNLKIDFSERTFSNLLYGCLYNTPTAMQFKRLQTLGANKELLDRKRQTLKNAFKKALLKGNINGSLKYAQAFTNEELEEILTSFRSFDIASEDFIGNLSLLIEKRDLK